MCVFRRHVDDDWSTGVGGRGHSGDFIRSKPRTQCDCQGGIAARIPWGTKICSVVKCSGGDGPSPAGTGIGHNLMPPYGSQPAPTVREWRCRWLGLVGFWFHTWREALWRDAKREGETKWRSRVCVNRPCTAPRYSAGAQRSCAGSASRRCRARDYVTISV
jgi:hypothetical protein